MITAEELEKLAELKDKGIVTEEEFNAVRDKFLNSSNTGLSPIKEMFNGKSLPDTANSLMKLVGRIQSLSKKSLIIGVIGILVIGYFIFGSSKISGGSNVGNEGFSIEISCRFNGSMLPLQACTGRSNAVLKTDNNRRSYNGYSMPSHYRVPKHFGFAIYNGSDKFTIDMLVLDIATRKTVAHRQIGPYDSDSIGN